jgi:hypothetical protein
MEVVEIDEHEIQPGLGCISPWYASTTSALLLPLEWSESVGMHVAHDIYINSGYRISLKVSTKSNQDPEPSSRVGLSVGGQVSSVHVRLALQLTSQPVFGPKDPHLPTP